METSSPAETEKWLTENGTEDFERTEEDYHFKANGIVRLRYVLLPETLSPHFTLAGNFATSRLMSRAC